MDLSSARQLALRLMAEHNLTQQGWTFKFNNRKNSAGVCLYLSKKICLSTIFTQSSSLEEVTDTILHEIAHAHTPKHGHDHVWRQKAREIGCKAERCFDLNENHENALLRIAPYKAICINGHEHFAFRKPKRKHSCGKCSRRFNPNYVLEYKRVA